MVVRRGLVSALQESLRTIPVLAMYGTQWIAWDWGEHRAVKAAVQCADTNPTMPVAHIFGRGSVFCAVEEAGHQSFTDMAFLLPPRVARMIHFFGDRYCIDSGTTHWKRVHACLSPRMLACWDDWNCVPGLRRQRRVAVAGGAVWEVNAGVLRWMLWLRIV